MYLCKLWDSYLTKVVPQLVVCGNVHKYSASYATCET